MKTLPRNTVLVGDAAGVVSGLLGESVDTVVTSPPYAGGVRDYGVAGQLGCEPTVHEYVANLRRVTRELRRVLKPHGAMWIVVGDVYARNTRQGVPQGSLLLAPQRLALALSADGWLVRNVCVWHKPNPLPQSASDRLSPTYEVVLLATKQRRYHFDLDAIRVPHRSADRARRSHATESRRYQGGNSGLASLKASGRPGHPNGRNPGDHFTIPTARDLLGHQATFPEALVEPLIRSSCPERICVQCDQAWRRPVRTLTVHSREGARAVRKVGALRRCDCFAPSRPGVVLDPFAGTATTAVVAERLGRDWLCVELSRRYAALARKRLAVARQRAA